MRLQEAIERYVEHKVASGVRFEKGEKNLLSFAAGTDASDLADLTPRDVELYLTRYRNANVTFRAKHSQMRHFLDYWAVRGEMLELRMPSNRPYVRQNFTPYVYSREEVKRLIRAARSLPPKWHVVHPQTYSAFLTTLYATGAMVGELNDLMAENVDLKRRTLTIQTRRFGRKRTLPMGRDIALTLERYAHWKDRQGLPSHGYFFPKKDGSRMVAWTLTGTFQKIRTLAEVTRSDGSYYQPRMHDLRTTFAVHRITSWIRRGADLNRLLPALAVYMGHAGMSATERYLNLTPERFRGDLNKLSPATARKRWRDDPELIAFLRAM